MQISNTLPQFEDVRTLLVVTGGQKTRFYYAYEGSIAEITSIQVKTPVYSDREGFFLKSGQGQTYGAGSVYEDKKESVRTEFYNELRKLIKAMTEEVEVEEIILYAPQHLAPAIRDTLPTHHKELLRHQLHGNYIDKKPLELLEILKKKTSE